MSNQTVNKTTGVLDVFLFAAYSVNKKTYDAVFLGVSRNVGIVNAQHRWVNTGDISATELIEKPCVNHTGALAAVATAIACGTAK